MKRVKLRTPKKDELKGAQRSTAKLIRRFAIRGASGFIALLVIEYFVLPELAGFRKSLHLITQANYLLVVVGIVLEALSLSAYGKLTQTLLPVRNRPSYSQILRIDLASLSVSHVLPGGTASGAGLSLRLMNSSGVSGADTGFAIATQGIGSALVLNALLWVSLIVSIPFAGFNKLYLTVALLGAVLIGVAASLIYLFTKGKRHSLEILTTVTKRLPLLRRFDFIGAFEKIGQRVTSLMADPDLLKRAAIWATLNWILDAGSLWVMLAAFGRVVNPDYLLVAYSVANVMAVLPITPSGLGVIEAFSTLLLVQFFSVPRGIAILGVITWRLFNFWVPIPVGVVSYVSLKISSGRGAADVTMELDKIDSPPELE
ncbi:lysylphosphatidylglycerol synthase transmembrane domain-containing protein [Ferrithrix thermotolerans]|uniref:lysylphosphatidylglycerol synthase transmembrane domain-containing protein n=1 Tax=Ferrithrix thermotolerans TaxID=209649 RepID=UPI00093519E4|nr:lysylphosphatidylglycerol synthase transmembrane domain-containing protein [Ferrithrix thermotolerans]